VRDRAADVLSEGAPVADNAADQPAHNAADYDDFFRLHYPHVVRVVHSILGDRARAEEVAQEAFVRLYLRWARVSTYDQPAAWTRRVAVRLAFRVSRRDRVRSALERRAATIDLSDEPAPATDLSLVRRLPRNQRVAVTLHYVEDLSIPDVAAAMGCAEATVRVHLHRARRRLAELMSWEVAADDGR
jgi:RNA polymerase sigma factor (sigma-70 family)